MKLRTQNDATLERRGNQLEARGEIERLLATRPDLPAATHAELLTQPLATVRFTVENFPRGERESRPAAMSDADAALERVIDVKMGTARSKVDGPRTEGNVLVFHTYKSAASAAASLAKLEGSEAPR